jgi:hypothetical protein
VVAANITKRQLNHECVVAGEFAALKKGGQKRKKHK